MGLVNVGADLGGSVKIMVVRHVELDALLILTYGQSVECVFQTLIIIELQEPVVVIVKIQTRMAGIEILQFHECTAVHVNVFANILTAKLVAVGYMAKNVLAVKPVCQALDLIL